MTEKIKMLNGNLYDAGAEELVAERLYAQEILFDFNSARPSEKNKRSELIRRLFGQIGESFSIQNPFRCDYGYNIFIGDNFYANYNCIILDCAKVSIGNNVMFAPNVSLFTAGHPVHFELRNTGLECAFPITIGDNVWIGGGVIINPGISIGNNVVIGSGSVVTKDIPPNSIAAGNPCNVLREIAEEDTICYFKRHCVGEKI